MGIMKVDELIKLSVVVVIAGIGHLLVLALVFTGVILCEYQGLFKIRVKSNLLGHT